MLRNAPVVPYIPATDIKRAREFYEKKVGLVPKEQIGGDVVYECGAGSWIYLYQSAGAGTSEASQAFWQVEDVEAEVRELRSRGVVFEEYDVPGMKTKTGLPQGAAPRPPGSGTAKGTSWRSSRRSADGRSAHRMTLQRGARLGPYEVLELTGTGGMGEVYKARDTRIHRTVALKTLNAVPDDEAGARGRLMHEARAVGALNHPHICALHDVGQSEGRDFLVMEFLEGETLAQRLARGRLPVDDVLQIGAQISSGLAAAHRAGVVHRDLKPANVMLTRGGVKLLDFGIAGYRAPDGPTPGATTASAAWAEPELAGTLPYMAPEQLEGRTIDRRADIFALGAVLFEMVTGSRAFQGTSSPAVIAAILADTRPRASNGDASVPRALDRLISACLARDPDKRPQDAADVVRELTWIGQDLTAPEARLQSPAPRRRWGVHAAWAAMLVAIAILSWTAADRRAKDLPPTNRTPVVVLMDSPLPGRVYDPRTAAAGGTNADDGATRLALLDSSCTRRTRARCGIVRSKSSRKIRISSSPTCRA